MKVNAFFVECFLLRGRLSITAALFCLVAIIYSALTFPEGTQLGSFIVGVFVFLEIFKELGRNEGVLDCADRWLAALSLILSYIVFVTAFCFMCSDLTGMSATDTFLMGSARIIGFIYCYFVRRVAYDDAISGNQATILAGERVSRMKSVCVCAIVTPCFARRFIPNLLASYREWSNRRMNEMVDGLILTLKGFEEKEH